mgnify:CR=1 FL=1
MTDRDVMKIVIHLLSAATNQFSLAICKECAEKLNQHFFGKKAASYSADAKKKIISLSVATTQKFSMSDSLKQNLWLDANEARKEAGLDEDEFLMEMINDIFFG